MTGPYDHACHICGVPDAPFDFGWPGPRKDHPHEEILWGCGPPRQEVERTNEKRTGHKAPKV